MRGRIVWMVAAVVAALTMMACLSCRGKQAAAPRAVADTAAAKASRRGPAPSKEPALPQIAKGAAQPEAAPKGAQSHIERLHTPQGIVTIIRTPRATAADLGVPPLSGVREKESTTWRMTPPKGSEWLLAIGQFTTTAPIEKVEQLYSRALRPPSGGTAMTGPAVRAPKREPPKFGVRRSESKGQILVVLTRVRDLGPAQQAAKEPETNPRESESIVVRLTRDKGSKVTTIVVRRAIRGAPVKIEPSGELPGKPRPRPKAPPKGIPV